MMRIFIITSPPSHHHHQHLHTTQRLQHIMVIIMLNLFSHSHHHRRRQLLHVIVTISGSRSRSSSFRTASVAAPTSAACYDIMWSADLRVPAPGEHPPAARLESQGMRTLAEGIRFEPREKGIER